MLRPHYSARLMHSRSRGPSEFFFSSGMPSKCLDQDCVGRRRTVACEPQTHFRSSLLSLRRERSDDRKCVCCSQATVQGLGMAMSTVASKTEKGNCCLSATCFANSDISARCFTSIYGKNVVVRVGGNGA